MEPYLLLVLLLQGSLTLAHNDSKDSDSRDILKNKPEIDDNVVNDFHKAKKDWIDMFIGPNSNVYKSSSAALMAHAINPDKSSEEQLEDIKDIAHKITEAIECEMVNLLSYALVNCEKGEHGSRTKRSISNPADNSHLVMRLLKHIKSNNDFQNIAIEKMMTAQEIANKYGIEYNPDPEYLADLASFATHQSKELSSIMSSVGETKNEQVEFVPLKENNDERSNGSYYLYRVPEEEIQYQLNSYPPHEYMPERVQFTPAPKPVHTPTRHQYTPVHQPMPMPHYPHPQPYYKQPETQIPSPPHHENCQCPHCQRRRFEASLKAGQENPPYCSMEPVTTTTTIVLPYEEPVAPQPELASQVFEETVTNKVVIESGEEPGSTDVEHVMTYTVSEKSHFKPPEVEKLPQQVQYYFFLMN